MIEITHRVSGHTMRLAASKGRITTTEDQKNFIGKVNDAGGVACVARKPEDIP